VAKKKGRFDNQREGRHEDVDEELEETTDHSGIDLVLATLVVLLAAGFIL
jgi:hypothetical protein